MDFEGKVAIVTGGAQGIGLCYCYILLKQGMKVCMCDNRDKPDEFFEKLGDKKNNVIFQKCDVTSFESMKNAFDIVKEKFGRIDLVVNNAGILDEKEWKKCIEVNLIGVIHGIQLGFQYMGLDQAGNGGYIVNTSSTVSIEFNPYAPIYCGTKYAVNGITKSYGTDFHFNKTGVKVNCILPGATLTPLYKVAATFSLDEKALKELQDTCKTVNPEETSKGLIKLLTENKNGALLIVDSEGARYVE